MRSRFPLAALALFAAFALAAAFQAVAQPTRPVVVVPGILGSVLERDGEVVWGDRLSLARFGQLEIADGPRDPDDGLVASGLIQSIQVFGPWKMDQYSGLRQVFTAMGYSVGVDYFEFPYDWRQSNFTTAARLRQWVDANERLAGREFDIVAHSMGGIVAEVFARRHDPTRQVRRLVTLGTPFLGSANALATLESGWGRIQNWMAGGMETIRRTSLSFPAMFELMPRYPNCCILGRPGDPDRQPYNIVAAEGWSKLDWGIPPQSPRAARIETVLARTAELGQLLSEPLPPHLADQAYRIAGDLIETRGQFYVDPSERKIVHWNAFLGDGTVLVRSAAKDEISRAYVSLTEHGTMFDDNSAIVTLGRILDPRQGGPLEFGSPLYSVVTRDGGLARLRSIDVSINPAIGLPGETVTVRIGLTGEAGDPVGQVAVAAAASDESGETALAFGTASIEDGFDSRRATFAGELKLGATPGPVRLVVSVPGLPPIHDFAMVVPKAPAP